MATTTKTTAGDKGQAKVERRYRNPKDAAGSSLRYFKHHSREQFIVVWERPHGEERAVYRHDTIEAARETWKRVVDRLKGWGFERVG